METTVVDWLIRTAADRGVSLTILFIILFKEIPAVKGWLDTWYRRRIEIENEDRKRAADVAERQVKAWERLSEQMSNMNLAFISVAQRMERVEGLYGATPIVPHRTIRSSDTAYT